MKAFVDSQLRGLRQKGTGLVRLSVRLKLLRGFELTVCGWSVPVAQASQRLISFLALQTCPVLHQYVARTLWPYQIQSRTSANLRTVFWRLSPLKVIGTGPDSLWRAPAVSVHLFNSRAHRGSASAPFAI